LTLPEDLQGGVTLDTVLLAKISLDRAVNLCNWDFGLLELGGSNLILGSYSNVDRKGECFAGKT